MLARLPAISSTIGGTAISVIVPRAVLRHSLKHFRGLLLRDLNTLLRSCTWSARRPRVPLCSEAQGIFANCSVIRSCATSTIFSLIRDTVISTLCSAILWCELHSSHDVLFERKHKDLHSLLRDSFLQTGHDLIGSIASSSLSAAVASMKTTGETGEAHLFSFTFIDARQRQLHVHRPLGKSVNSAKTSLPSPPRGVPTNGTRGECSNKNATQQKRQTPARTSIHLCNMRMIPQFHIHFFHLALCCLIFMFPLFQHLLLNVNL